MALQQDVVEALLGRLTAPSVRLAAQLGSDPQVDAARQIAKDVENLVSCSTPLVLSGYRESADPIIPPPFFIVSQ